MYLQSGDERLWLTQRRRAMETEAVRRLTPGSSGGAVASGDAHGARPASVSRMAIKRFAGQLRSVLAGSGVPPRRIA